MKKPELVFLVIAFAFLAVIVAKARGHEPELWLEERMNQRVYTVLDSLGLLEEGTPPPEPAPEPTPEPTPVPTPGAFPHSDENLVGGDDLSDFWEGWRGRDRAKVVTLPGNTSGAMQANTKALTEIDLGLEGFMECEFRYVKFRPGDDFRGGGQHLLAIQSQTSCNVPCLEEHQGIPDELEGWCRIDLGTRTDSIRPTIYTKKSGVHREFAGQTTPATPGDGAWHRLRLAWKQDAGRIRVWLRIDGEERETNVTLPSGLNPAGRLLVIGNMDLNSGQSRCGSPDAVCGMLGEIQFRAWSAGRL
jgi:hypothetical protein